MFPQPLGPWNAEAPPPPSPVHRIPTPFLVPQGQTWLSDDLLFKIGEFCPNLKLLNLAGCMQLSSRTIIRIAEGCQLLALVNLSHCTNVSGEAVARLLQNCPQLQVLCLSGLPLDHGGVSTFRTLHSSRRIRALDLSYCAGLTDQSLIAISQYCPALEWLNLSGCTSVGDMGVAAIGSRLTRLAVLIMKLCSQDTLRPAGLHALANGIRNLKRLDLSGVTQLDNATLKHILKQVRGPQYLEFQQHSPFLCSTVICQEENFPPKPRQSLRP